MNLAMAMDNAPGLRRKQAMTSAGLGLKKSWLFLLLSVPVAMMVTSKADDGIAATSQRGTMHEVIDVVLPVTLDRFLKAFILDDRFTYRIFQQAKDKDVRLGPWAKSSSGGDGGAAGRGRGVTAMTRSIEYSHPVKTKFPGMPSHAKTYKRQDYAYNPRQGILELEEHLRFEGIPKADHFDVQTAWKVRSLGGKRAGQKPSSNVTISLRVNILKNTILRKTIESRTLVEQGESLQNWIAAARETLADQASTTGLQTGGGTNRFPPPGGEGVSLDSCPSKGIRSFLGRKLGGLFQKLRIRESDDQPAPVAQ